MAADERGPELRVLVLAPYGRDGAVICEVLHDAGLEGAFYEGMVPLCSELETGAGAVIVTAEALNSRSMATFVSALREQPAWSDIPIVLAADVNHARAARDWALRELEPASHVTLLERPVRIQTLVTVVLSALTTRRRQYELRDLVEELRATVEHLDAEHLVRESFVNLLAHDLRGPLGVIKASADMLRFRPEHAELIAGRIGNSVDRADKMIRNLLDAHRLRAGQRLPLDLRPCDLVEIAREVVAGLDEENRRRLVVQLEGLAEPHGIWDADLLWRALWNLVTNAIKYGASDTPITISVGYDEDEGWVSVHNLGASIPAEEQGQLFAAFSRTDSAKTGSQQGWGLGLTLVEGVAASHGGRLEVRSDPGQGTTFTLRLPEAAESPRG